MIRKFLFLLFCSVGALAQENTSVIDLLNSSSNDIVVAQKGTANASAVSGKASEFNFVNSVQDGFENQLDLFLSIIQTTITSLSRNRERETTLRLSL